MVTADVAKVAANPVDNLAANPQAMPVPLLQAKPAAQAQLQKQQPVQQKASVIF